jgi:hypothetical protein
MMNDFLYQELLAEEYRRDQIANAAKYNCFNTPSGKKLNLNIYKILSRTGEHIQGLGSRMQERYEQLAQREERNMLPNPAK